MDAGAAPRSEADLVRLIASRDRSAEEEFARRYRPRVRLMTWARTRDRAAADDLAQEIVVACLEALRAGRVRFPDHLPGFVQVTARHLIDNYFRTRRRRPVEVPLSENLAAPPLPDAAVEAERRVALRQGLSRLREVDRAILRMTLVDGLEAPQVASKLGMRPEAVRARHCRAIRKLTRWIRPVSRRTLGPPLEGRRPAWTADV